jgi:hypothetical protein
MRNDPDYVQSQCTQGSLALIMATARRCSYSSLTVLDPPDRVVDNLLDEFLLGAMATFRVVATSVVSTT